MVSGSCPPCTFSVRKFSVGVLIHLASYKNLVSYRPCVPEWKVPHPHGTGGDDSCYLNRNQCGWAYHESSFPTSHSSTPAIPWKGNQPYYSTSVVKLIFSCTPFKSQKVIQLLCYVGTPQSVISISVKAGWLQRGTWVQYTQTTAYKNWPPPAKVERAHQHSISFCSKYLSWFRNYLGRTKHQLDQVHHSRRKNWTQ